MLKVDVKIAVLSYYRRTESDSKLLIKFLLLILLRLSVLPSELYKGVLELEEISRRFEYKSVVFSERVFLSVRITVFGLEVVLQLLRGNDLVRITFFQVRLEIRGSLAT